MKKSTKHRIIISIAFVAILAPLYLFGGVALAAALSALAIFAGLMVLDVVLAQKKSSSPPKALSAITPNPVELSKSVASPQSQEVRKKEIPAQPQPAEPEKTLALKNTIAEGYSIIMEYAIAHAMKSAPKESLPTIIGKLMLSEKYDGFLMRLDSEKDTLAFLKGEIERLDQQNMQRMDDLELMMIYNFYGRILWHEEAFQKNLNESPRLKEAFNNVSFLPLSVNILEKFKAVRHQILSQLLEGETVLDLTRSKEDNYKKWALKLNNQAQDYLSSPASVTPKRGI